MKWSYGITTVSERFGTVLPTTLESLSLAGFPEPRLFVDGVSLPPSEMQDRYWITWRSPRIGLSSNWGLSIVELYLREPHADRYAIFQDDVIAVRNLRQYLEACSYPNHGYLNLFSFRENESKAGRDKPMGWTEGAEMPNSRGSVYHGKRQQFGLGALALVFDRKSLLVLLGHSHFINRPQYGESSKRKIDGGIVESMNQAGWREFVHNPSLVSHLGTISTKPGKKWSENAMSFPGQDFDAMEFLPKVSKPIALPPTQKRSSSTKIRVGLITPTLLFGGAERWVASIATGLDRSRIDVSGVVSLNPGMVFQPIGQKIKEHCLLLEDRSGVNVLMASSDILIIWGLTNLSLLSGFAGRVIMVSHGHCAWTTRIIRNGLPYITDRVAVSRHAANSFPDASRVTVLHNGIDTDRCQAERSREDVRYSWGMKPGEIAIGYVGRMSAEKNPLDVVKTAKKLGSPYRAVLIGGGAKTKEFLRQARHILADVIYQPPVENVGDMYRALDCFILTSPSEGFSLALTEAWYCGCPTVSTPVGATELAEQHGMLGITVPVGASAAVIGNAVQEAMSPGNQSTIAKASRVVSDGYTEEAMCRRWSEYLLSLT